MTTATFHRICLLLSLACAGFSVAMASEKGGIFDWGEAPADLTAAPTNNSLGTAVREKLGSPLDQGRILLSTRLRYEYANQQGLANANAFTLRTRIGYQTARYHGFWGVAEFENNWAINASDYAPYPPPNNNGRTVIADPRNNELNQLFLGYSGFNSEVKGGRQIILLDNQRFVGAVAWRQNDQTFDAVRASTEVVRDVWFSYAWNWRVNRVFGTYAPQPTLRRFLANNHFLNAHYNGLDSGQLGTYFYYIDLDQAAAASGSTAGLFYDASLPLSDDWRLLGRAEYAIQVDNAASGPGSFYLNYWHLKAALEYQAVQAGLGFESLGGNGTRAFQTPLATLHAYNGWADVFLVTPADGLNDYYAWAQAKVADFTARLDFHFFTSSRTGQTYGREIDASLSRPITDYLSFTTKVAWYDGFGSAPPALAADRMKFWLQFDFSL